MADLTKGRIDYLIADRHYINEMAVNGGYLRRGPFAFRTLVLPPIDILETETAQKIVAFARQGGVVYALGELPSASVDAGAMDPDMVGLMETLRQLPSFTACKPEPETVSSAFTHHWMGWKYNTETDSYGLMPYIRNQAKGLTNPLQFVRGEFEMLQEHRVIDGAHFFWLVNNTESPQSAVVKLWDIQGSVSLWDCETGQCNSVTSEANGNGRSLELRFDPLQAYWLVVDPKSRKQFEPLKRPEKLIEKVEIQGSWRIYYDPEGQPELKPVWEIPHVLSTYPGLESVLVEWGNLPEMNKRFTGFLDYTVTCEISRLTAKMYLDLGRVHDIAEVWVNGKSVGKRLWMPYRFEIGRQLKTGTNTLHVRVGNRIDNYYYSKPIPSGLLGPVQIVSYE